MGSKAKSILIVLALGSTVFAQGWFYVPVQTNYRQGWYTTPVRTYTKAYVPREYIVPGSVRIIEPVRTIAPRTVVQQVVPTRVIQQPYYVPQAFSTFARPYQANCVGGT